MVHRRKPSLCQNDHHIGGSFWHGILRLDTMHHESPPRPQRSGFAQPNLSTLLFVGHEQAEFSAFLNIFQKRTSCR